MLESFGFRNEGSFSSDLKVSILPKTKTRLPKPPGKPNQITKYVQANKSARKHHQLPIGDNTKEYFFFAILQRGR